MNKWTTKEFAPIFCVSIVERNRYLFINSSQMLVEDIGKRIWKSFIVEPCDFSSIENDNVKYFFRNHELREKEKVEKLSIILLQYQNHRLI